MHLDWVTKVRRNHAWEMYQTIQQNPKQSDSMSGVLAEYGAQKFLLSEYKQDWALRLACNDRKSD